MFSLADSNFYYLSFFMNTGPNHDNWNLVSESFGSYWTLELWLLTNAIKYGGLMEKKSHLVKNDFELMVLFTFFKPACSSNYKRFDQSNKCWLLTMGFIISRFIVSNNWNANGWVTNKEKLIPNGVKCNVKHNWLSVLRRTFLEHKRLPCGTEIKYYVLY